MGTCFKACSVSACKGNAHGSAKGCRGYCSRHYVRLRSHGDLDLSRSRWGELRRWLEQHASYDGQGCLLWPFARGQHGYGQVSFDGKQINAHRAMCIIAHGPPTSDKLEAAHSCGCAHLGCVHPQHLRWDTKSGNFADKIGHGTLNRGPKNPVSKLTEADVLKIIELRGSMTQQAIGNLFGISQSNVSLLQRGKSWKWFNKIGAGSG